MFSPVATDPAMLASGPAGLYIVMKSHSYRPTNRTETST